MFLTPRRKHYPTEAWVRVRYTLPARLDREDNEKAGEHEFTGGLKEGWTRATFILKKEHLEKIKAAAYWDRKKVKEVMDEALDAYFRRKRIRSNRRG